MGSLIPKEENIIKDIRNCFWLKKEQNYTVKDIRKIFRLRKEIKWIKNLFECEKEEGNYHKPVKVYNIWSNNIKYKSSGDRNKTLSVREYLDKVRPYLKDIINDLKQSDTWKIQLTITISFISSVDDNDEKRVMHW